MSGSLFFFFGAPRSDPKIGPTFQLSCTVLVLLANFVFVLLIYEHWLVALAFFYFTKPYTKPNLL